MPYIPVPLKETLSIPSLVTVHYYEYGSNFHYSGESHDFWEFLCVDKGEVEVFAGERFYTLSRGDIIFHKPNEFHGLNANHRIAPNLVVVAFCCTSPAMDFFRERILVIDDYERDLLARMISEARHCFLDPLDDPYLTRMRLRPDAPVGCLQILQSTLCLLLLSLLRRYQKETTVQKEKDTIRRKKDDEAYHRIVACMGQHLHEHLSLSQLSRETLMGRSQLQKLVKKRHDCGVIDLFLQQKTEAAREMIRENRMNFTEISQALGYSSIHYFSRQFKKITGMTPSEYSSSIKGLTEENSSSIKGLTEENSPDFLSDEKSSEAAHTFRPRSCRGIS